MTSGEQLRGIVVGCPNSVFQALSVLTPNCASKISNLKSSRGMEENVVGFNVTVNNLFRMDVVQAVEELKRVVRQQKRFVVESRKVLKGLVQ